MSHQANYAAGSASSVWTVPPNVDLYIKQAASSITALKKSKQAASSFTALKKSKGKDWIVLGSSVTLQDAIVVCFVQINDRYEFPDELDLDADDGKFLAPGADRSVRNLYKLHSVLVHSGGVHGGHYYAYIRPASKQWLKFDDEKVQSHMLTCGLHAFALFFCIAHFLEHCTASVRTLFCLLCCACARDR